MANPTLIDLFNYDTLLKESTEGRAGSPNGNIFFNTTDGTIELITREELAEVDLGSGLEPNGLCNQEGITEGAIYGFERKCRRTNEFLRQFDTSLGGTFKFAGAYELVNGRKFATNGSIPDDRKKLRGSGWLERKADGSVDKIFFGVRSLGNIEDLSQPYYQLTEGGAPTDFAKDGSVDEAIEVIAPANFLSIKVRTFGRSHDEKTLVDSGISEMSGYSAGFALGESPHLTTGQYDLADVYGALQVSPWTGMSLEKLAVAQEEGGFVAPNTEGEFTWVLHNTANGSLNQCVAFLDALAQTDDDIDTGELTITQGKRVRTWYSYDALGRIVTRSGADALGLFIENIPTVDQQRIVFTADDGLARTYPFLVQLTITVGANAAADPLAWYHVWKAAGYGTASAATVLDKDGNPMKGSVGGLTSIAKAFDYDGQDPVEPLPIVVECEGDGVATQAKATATITRDPIVPVTCSPSLETNL